MNTVPNRREGLAYMDRFFDGGISLQNFKASVSRLSLLGDRPCKGDVDPKELTEIVKHASALYGYERSDECGSTDCNIPLSMGIPAVCFGVYEGQGAHNSQRMAFIESTRTGMKILAQVLLSEIRK